MPHDRNLVRIPPESSSILLGPLHCQLAVHQAVVARGIRAAGAGELGRSNEAEGAKAVVRGHHHRPILRKRAKVVPVRGPCQRPAAVEEDNNWPVRGAASTAAVARRPAAT